MSDPQADCNTLLGIVMPFAEQLLAQHGMFHPFGAALAPDGEAVPVTGYDGRDTAPAEDIIALLTEAFVEGAETGRYVATALAFDATIEMPEGGETSAVAIQLDHRDGLSVVVYFPYRLEDGRVAFDPSLQQDGASEIFAEA